MKGIIYCIQNDINKKCYIGQTIDSLNKRWQSHIRCAKCKKYKPRLFYLAIRKYGENNFTPTILKYCETKEQLDQSEQEYIIKYNSLRPNGYNLENGGNNRGKWTNEQKKRKSENMKGNKFALGLKHTEEFKNRIRQIHKGNKYNCGRIVSEEHKEKISKTLKGRIFTSKHKRKMSNARKGIIFTPEHKNNISLAKKRKNIYPIDPVYAINDTDNFEIIFEGKF